MKVDLSLPSPSILLIIICYASAVCRHALSAYYTEICIISSSSEEWCRVTEHLRTRPGVATNVATGAAILRVI